MVVEGATALRNDYVFSLAFPKLASVPCPHAVKDRSEPNASSSPRRGSVVPAGFS